MNTVIKSLGYSIRNAELAVSAAQWEGDRDRAMKMMVVYYGLVGERDGIAGECATSVPYPYLEAYEGGRWLGVMRRDGAAAPH